VNELKQKFEALYNGEQSDPLEPHRKTLVGFYEHLMEQTPRVRKHTKECFVWKQIGALLNIDYRVLRSFAFKGKTPQKKTWKKLKPLLDLLEEKEND
jgi:hypothetical protein